MTLAVAILGLGEAGGAIAADLVTGGYDVRGWDPAVPSGPDGVTRPVTAAEAVAGADLVLSLTTAGHALDAATSVAASLGADQVYADLSTSAPGLKLELAAVIAPSRARFADVALLGPVPTHGARTRALASGDGARRFAELAGTFGMPVDLVGGEPGDAAALKLLRSVFMKGLAASVLESTGAAKRRDADAWLRAEIAAVLGEPLLERLLTGSVAHAGRRLDEMEAAAALLDELGVEPRVARAAAEWLRQLTTCSDRQPSA